MNRKLIRPHACFLPIALGTAAMFGAGIEAGMIIAGFIMSAIFTLGGAATFRMGAAMQTDPRRINGGFLCAVALAIVAGICTLLLGKHTDICSIISGYIDSGRTLTAENQMLLLGVGAMLNLEQICEEKLHARGDEVSPALCSSLAAVFTCAALIMDVRSAQFVVRANEAIASSGISANAESTLLSANLSGDEIYTATAALLALLGIGNLILLASSRLRDGIARPFWFFRYAPDGLLRTAIYPLVMLPLCRSGNFTIAGFCAGCALLQLSCSTFRRSAQESAALRTKGFFAGSMLVLALTAASIAAQMGFFADPAGIAKSAALSCGIALVISHLLYGALNVRVMLALIFAACGAGTTAFAEELAELLSAQNMMFVIRTAGMVMIVAAQLPMIPDWQELARIRRIQKIRTAGMKKRMP